MSFIQTLKLIKLKKGMINIKILKVIVDEALPKSCLECDFSYSWEDKCFCNIKRYSTNKINDYVGEDINIKNRHINCPLVYNEQNKL